MSRPTPAASGNKNVRRHTSQHPPGVAEHAWCAQAMLLNPYLVANIVIVAAPGDLLRATFSRKSQRPNQQLFSALILLAQAQAAPYDSRRICATETSTTTMMGAMPRTRTRRGAAGLPTGLLWVPLNGRQCTGTPFQPRQRQTPDRQTDRASNRSSRTVQAAEE